MKIRYRELVFALTPLLWVSGLAAQEYPNRPVKLIVGYPPGGSPDALARLLAPKLTQSLGQAFVVENKPGAGATLATAEVARSPADGYTLLVAETASLVIAPYVYKALVYDTLKDLAPIARVSNLPMVLVASSRNSHVKSLADLIREARANPGKLNYASLGASSIHALGTEAMKAALGINITQIPYKGGIAAVAAVLAGEVDLTYTSLSTVKGLGKSAGDKAHVVAIAVSSIDRDPQLPDVPAVSEVIKGYDFSPQYGILAPAGIPPVALAKLSGAIKAAVYSPDVQDRFKSYGFVTTLTSPEGYTENIRKELEKYARAVKVANIQPE